MYDDLPALVDSTTGQPAQTNGWPQITSLDPWATVGTGGVTPGGFGAGIPLPQQSGRSHPFGPNARAPGGETPPYAFAAPLGTPHPAMRGFSGETPWAPAAAFDQRLGPSLARQNPYPQAGMVGGPSWPAFGVEPPPAARQRPRNAAWLTPQPTPHQQLGGFGDDDDEEFDEDEGLQHWNGAGWGSPAWGSSPGWNPWDMPGTPLRRTRSAGAASSVPSHGTIPRLKYARPDTWRPEFSTRPIGLKRLLSFGRGRSSPKGDIGRERSLSFRSVLGRSGIHWSLDAKERACSWDIRIPPTTGFIVRPDKRNLDYIELHESAFSPATTRVRLIHPSLPWYIHVVAPHNSIVTVTFLLEVLFYELQNPVLHSDFWNDDVSEEYRKAIHATWMARVGANRELAEQGLKRVDFLCDRFMFEGLKRAGDDWELKMKPLK